MANQYFVPGDGMVNPVGSNQYFVPGDGMFNEAAAGGGGGGGEPSGMDKLMRHGCYFEDGIKQPFWWAR